MAFLASVPILLALVALLYFVSCRIVDHQIRSAEREYGRAPSEPTMGPEPAVPPVVPGVPAPR
ncbi:hypothetical protein ACIBED_08210 [Rhodococcus coprophilus]|uniref:Uncharacterized protein n=1 Tax=Rhodococcus coprophilus TaxID=38310 RepID=A0A2X4U2S5_9NOCA|nr:hypothetical protein [Rhodococcus coprophilus]MBM7458799.1 hypothetical protein [Rhodococcus coprophilus]SQI33523.1 Uncharacterised protein [Rhodococcus coprophilus]